MAPSAVNDVIREVMASVRRKDTDEDGTLITAGGTTAYTVAAPNRTIASLASGIKLRLRFNAVNAANATLNVNSLGAVALRMPGGAAVGPGYFALSGVYEVVYGSPNSTAGWYVQTPVAEQSRRTLALTGAGANTLEANKSYITFGAGTHACTLPALSAAAVGDEIEIMTGSSANPFTVAPAGSDSILWADGAAATTSAGSRSFGGSGATATQCAVRLRKLDTLYWFGFPYGYL